MAMRRKGPQAGFNTTKVPVYMTNSVGRQSPNRRQPNEAENIDNALVSLERNFEKRPGFEIVPQKTAANATSWDIGSTAIRLDLYALANVDASHDLWYYWYNINEDNTFLVVVDFSATSDSEKLFYIFRVFPTGTWEDLTPAVQTNASGVVSSTSRAYITYNPNDKTAKESLKAVSLGSSIVVLNTNVKAGLSSDTAGKLFDLSGTVTANDDIEGRRVVYYSAAKAMKVYDIGDDGTPGSTDDLLLGWKPGVITGLIHSNANISATGTTPVIVTSSTNIPVSYLATGQGSTITVSGRTFTISGATSTLSSGLYHYTLTVVGSSPALSVSAGTTYSITIAGAAYIPASDYFYYDSAKAYLGQRVDDISQIRLPPENDDFLSNNGTSGDTKAKDMLTLLYDPDTQYPSGTTAIAGRGKIYYAINPYLNTTAGYYRVVSFTEGNTLVSGSVTYTGAGRPYLQKIRTPDEHSVIDYRRMPQKIVVSIDASNVTNWKIEPIKWTPRTSGDKATNPGPSIFKTVDRKSLRHPSITGLAVFKDRLWFSADDVIFCTQTGEYENLFLDDPSNIVTTDPIDIRVSSNNYCEITSMTPFEEYMFINTKANIQFQLMSANGQEMSPTNVAIAPVTYYGTAPILDPQFIGSRLYFFDAQRLFLFTGKGTMGYASAAEVSTGAMGYLPKNYRTAATAPSQDTLLFVDDDNRNHIYGYINRFSGDRVIQNSFYRYILAEEESIETLKCYNNYMYALSKRETTAGSGTYKYYLYRNYMITEDVYVPRLDRMFKMKIISSDYQAVNYNAKYDPYSAMTTYRIPGHTDITDIEKYFVVLSKGWYNNGNSTEEDLSNVAIQPYSVTNTTDGSGNPYTEIVVIGADYAVNDYYVYIGIKYKMSVELSTLFVRDENNNIIDGVLNIRSAIFRHYYTGPYDIEVTHRGRTAFTTSYIPTRPDYTVYEDPLPLEIFQKQGEFVSKIVGYSDSLVIKITSEYPTPVNITNMEFKGKFKQKYTTIDT